MSDKKSFWNVEKSHDEVEDFAEKFASVGWKAGIVAGLVLGFVYAGIGGAIVGVIIGVPVFWIASFLIGSFVANLPMILSIIAFFCAIGGLIAIISATWGVGN